MWKLRHREVKSFVWGYTALTHHSQYLNPSDLGLFTWRHQILASRHPGPSTWEGTAPEHFLPSLASAYDVESAYDVRGRTAPPLKAVQSLPTILYTLLSSPCILLPACRKASSIHQITKMEFQVRSSFFQLKPWEQKEKSEEDLPMKPYPNCLWKAWIISF